ncbi:prephenate dehydrogenase [Salsuginibacillus kocurii]|uniref:prephenate dehydrogenase n=1 Tax=Salsuginibacillus kocurii TaxID=427078 RepID=UPI00036CE45E|nr:prephenate dehydrogenase [Salsuginibacillus kocurii]
MNKKVCVIGLGLIGGSISLAIQAEHEATVIGVDVDEQTLKLAKSLKVIHEGTKEVAEGVKEADLIVLSVPVTKTDQLLAQLAELPLKSGAIITDVGSTKTRIFQTAERLQELDVTFVGGHPMAGSHKTGVSAAREHLFENAYYILTPSPHTNPRQIIQLQNWLKGTKARFMEMTPDQHDRLAGVVSHFPHVVAAGLVHQVEEMEKDDPVVARLAAGGFRDITRIASASPEMWRDILLHNKESLLSIMDQWLDNMNSIRGFIQQEESEAIFDYFARAKTYRDGLPPREQGALAPFYDLYVDVPDHPGVISDVTGILAKAKISIINIQIIETREDIMGVLRLTFRSEDDRTEGIACLRREMYETHILD